MNINSNGIPVVGRTSKKSKRVPLEYALDTVTFWRKEQGQTITIVVPKFSHLKKCLQEDGWRVQRGETK